MHPLFIYMTAPDRTSARALAKALVEERLCACANIIDGMESFYWWDGNIENGRESVLVCKTTERLYPAFEARARELHPFEVPCIVALPLAGGFAPFLRWVEDSTRR